MRMRYVFRKCTLKSLSCTRFFLLFSFCLLFLAGTVRVSAAASATQQSSVQKSDSAKGANARGSNAKGSSAKASSAKASKQANGNNAANADAKHKKKQDAKASAKRQSRQPSRGLHGASFGFETQRSKSYWNNNGIDGEDLMRHAVRNGKQKPAKAQSEKAQSEAKETQQPEKKRNLRFSVDSEKSDWRALPGEKFGEDVNIKGQHRMRAFATSEDEDISLGVGPEVIVRDTQNIKSYAQDPSQPDVDTGVGMRMQFNW